MKLNEVAEIYIYYNNENRAQFCRKHAKKRLFLLKKMTIKAWKSEK